MENYNSSGRIGTLGFDAMSLSPALRYDETKDAIGGFEQLDGSRRTHKVANQGLVAVVRTIKDKTKLPIGFNLIQHNPSQSGFNMIVNSYLEAAHAAGMLIVSITCDQERTQWAWLKSAGVSPNWPFIFHPCTSIPVYVIPDPPHLLKNACNCLSATT